LRCEICRETAGAIVGTMGEFGSQDGSDGRELKRSDFKKRCRDAVIPVIGMRDPIELETSVATPSAWMTNRAMTRTGETN
jgi:hypothetical protein